MAGTSSLERALILLKVIERTPGGLRNADIGRQLKIPKSSCSYIVRRLEREGYLIKDPVSQRYKIGLTPIALAHGALGNPSEPVWDDLAQLVRTVEEAVRDISWRARILLPT